MTDPGKDLVDGDSKIDPNDYYESTDKAFENANSPLDYAGGVGSFFFTEGVGEKSDDYENPVTKEDMKGTGWLTGLPIADDTMAFANALEDSKTEIWGRIEQGQWPDPQAVIALIAAGAGMGADALSGFDPAGTALSYEVSWLINHFRPFRLMIDGLTGIPEVIKGCAKTWENIQGYLEGVSSEFHQTFQRGPGNWSGPGYDAYLNMAATVAASLDACAVMAKALGTLILSVGDVVAGVRSLIISLIASLVGLLPDIGEALVGDEPQAGAGAAAKVAKVTQEGTTLIEELRTVLSLVIGIEGTLVTLVSTINSAVKDYRAG
jgi:hypothetical protein